MLISAANSIYMIDRDNAVYSVPKIVFPKRKDSSASLADTLLDGVSFPDKLITYSPFVIHCISFSAFNVHSLLHCINCENLHVVINELQKFKLQPLFANLLIS